MRSLALTLLVAGCLDLGTGVTQHTVDACSAPALATERCVTVNLQPSDALMGMEVTGVLMWVIYNEAGTTRGSEVVTPMEKPSKLPVALGLHLPIGLENSAELFAIAENGPGYVAYGKTGTDPNPGDHLQVDISMADVRSTGCFDHVFSSNQETDVDCGEECPPCATGLHCISASDCQSGNCFFDVNNDVSTCQ
jgi:hypothetical protein